MLVACGARVGGELMLVACGARVGGELMLVACGARVGGELMLVACGARVGGELMLVACGARVGGELMLVLRSRSSTCWLVRPLKLLKLKSGGELMLVACGARVGGELMLVACGAPGLLAPDRSPPVDKPRLVLALRSMSSTCWLVGFVELLKLKAMSAPSSR